MFHVFQTDADSDGKTDFIIVFSRFVLIGRRRVNVMGNRSAKIEADKAGVNLLFHILTLFGVEMKKVKGVFQIAERGFLSPAHIIEFLDFLKGKLVGGKVCIRSFMGKKG